MTIGSWRGYARQDDTIAAAIIRSIKTSSFDDPEDNYDQDDTD